MWRTTEYSVISNAHTKTNFAEHSNEIWTKSNRNEKKKPTENWKYIQNFFLLKSEHGLKKQVTGQPLN